MTWPVFLLTLVAATTFWVTAAGFAYLRAYHRRVRILSDPDRAPGQVPARRTLMNLVEWSMALKGHLEAGETRGPNLYSRITAFAFLWGYAITTRTNRDAALLERQFRVSPGLVEREVQKAHSQAEATCNRLGLEFGVSGYRDTIEDLPFVVDRMERYRTRAASTFDAYGWKKI